MLQETDYNPVAPPVIYPKRSRGRPKGSGKNKPTSCNAVGRPRKNAEQTSIKTTIVFHANKAANTQVVLNRGGARSSKSYSLMQYCIDAFFTIPKIKILMLRKYSPSLRLSIKPLFFEIIDAYNLRNRITEVRSDMNVFSPCKGMIHFSGLDDPEKIRSSDWNIVWIEEASEFDYESFINLKLRLSAPVYQDFRNKIFLSFNPVDEYSWLKTKVLEKESPEDLTEIVSTYRLNPFLSAQYRKTIEDLKYQDTNYYRIFAEGEWGRLEHIIYKNYITVPILPEGEEIFGLDWGFNNPTVLVKTKINGLEVGTETLLYQTGLTNSDLMVQLNRILTIEQRESCVIYCDSAEPARIQELNDNGFWAEPADKSVKDGIDYVKRCQLKIKEDSDNLLKEIRGYSYRTNKDGRVLEEPIAFNNHCMDALRYAVYSNYVNTSRNMPDIKVLDFTDSQSRDEWGDDD